MALWMISYDEHPSRNYDECYKLMAEWKAKRLLDVPVARRADWTIVTGVNPVTSEEHPVHHAPGMAAAAARSAA